jgi:S1-C subfamily serine protease
MSTRLSNRNRQLLLRILRDLPDFRTVRGRQALVENAVGGYPKSAQLLGNLEWEGSAMVVANDLLRWFDGFELAKGVEALPLLLSAIEPLVASSDRAALIALKQHQRWGTEPQAEAGERWRDSRSPTELKLERIIGENTLRHVNMLRKALRAANAVVRITVPSEGYGTGFMVAADLMMTNNHVVANTSQAAGVETAFFYELDIDGSKRDEVVVGTATEGLVYTNPKLDVSLVRLRNPPDFGAPLGLKRTHLEQNQRVAIIQHPGGFMKKISLQNNFVAAADEELIQYYTSTEAGSSGSPVFNEDFQVVGLHRGYIELAEPDPEDRQFRNQGSSMIAILRELEVRVPEILEMLTILS